LHDDIELTDSAQLTVDDPDAGTKKDLESLLHQLPDMQRIAIELTKLQGLTTAEAAAQTGLSISAIKVQVHRGIKRLSELIQSSS
jgi:RNA polymerase sigma-70 factor (ECF subfamily)